MRAAVLGFGCRLSASETEAMVAALARASIDAAPVETADVVVVNGCTITHEADRDARAAVRRIHRANPAAKIVVAGCFGASAGASAASLPGVVAVVGNAEKAAIVEVVRAAQRHTGPPDVTIARLVRGSAFTLEPVADARARALLAVQDGCDYRCAFCIVPSVRGPSRSAPEDLVVARARELVARGVAEIVLTGVHLGTWGRDLRAGRGALAGLVARLLDVVGDARLRLSSIDPHEVDDAMLGLFVAHPRRLCAHLHLPVQSCDDDVLARMRRGHRRADFVDLVARATAQVPGIAVSTDVIAGHPGESDEAFARTRDTLAALPLAYMHVFPYSKRAGTAAAAMDDAVAPAVVRARAASLREVSAAHEARFRAAAAGDIVDVVVHRAADRAGVWWARSHHDLAFDVGDASMHAGRRVAARVAADGRHAELLA
jgi:threonylcarbamoyladenosine tRNA methylthiotransferase MtaB